MQVSQEETTQQCEHLTRVANELAMEDDTKTTGESKTTTQHDTTDWNSKGDQTRLLQVEAMIVPHACEEGCLRTGFVDKAFRAVAAGARAVVV